MRNHAGFWRIGPIVLVLSLVGFGWTTVPTVGGTQGTLQTQLTVLMGEFFFQAEGAPQNAPITLNVAVPYRITFKNVGKAVHRVKFGRGLVVEEGVPFSYTEDLFEGVKVRVQGKTSSGSFKIDMERFSELEIEPGVELEALFTLPQSKQGEWELGCFVIGHYEQGMKTKLIIQ